jgi:hypothetical protein
MGTGNAAIDAYFFYAVAGTTCLLFAYLLVEIAVFAAWRKGAIQVRTPELALPALGSLFIVVVIYYTVTDATGISPAYAGLIWVAAGVGVALAARNLTHRIGISLTRELSDADVLARERASLG